MLLFIQRLDAAEYVVGKVGRLMDIYVTMRYRSIKNANSKGLHRFLSSRLLGPFQ